MGVVYKIVALKQAVVKTARPQPRIFWMVLPDMVADGFGAVIDGVRAWKG